MVVATASNVPGSDWFHDHGNDPFKRASRRNSCNADLTIAAISGTP
jgi:hypothetical protein